MLTPDTYAILEAQFQLRPQQLKGFKQRHRDQIIALAGMHERALGHPEGDHNYTRRLLMEAILDARGMPHEPSLLR